MEVLIRAGLSSQCPHFSVDLITHQLAEPSAMGAFSVCAFSLLSALLLLHYCLLAPSAIMVSKERIQSRKLLQSVLVSSDSEKARREVFQAAAKAADKVPARADEVSENLKKQTPSRSNPIQN